MSGCELRIIAELAQAQSWITAFAKGQDVHSVSTEILYPEKWPTLACKGGELWFDPEKKKEVILPPCAYFELDAEGKPKHLKCKCPGHVELRNNTKAINFLLCYGGGPDALADELGVSLDTAKKLMKLHEEKFPEVWAFLYRSGEAAKRDKEARDMYGRRRLFPEPTYELGREWFIDHDDNDVLELDEEECASALFNFKAKELREPNEEEKWSVTHRAPTDREIKQGMRAMMGSIGRRGKNHRIQGTNASIIKRAMGCGFDKDGKPYLWHTLPALRARIQNMVHDELVVHCPLRFGEQVKAVVGDAFKRAAAEVMTQVVMEFDGHIADRWMK
jgi:DNA polymerase I-like protein with 3'-5' exonuclease and polymerase domains